MIPQWPWSVYSQKHISEMTSRSGTASLIARIACGTMPSGLVLSLPVASLAAGMPNRITAGMPSAAISRASAASLSTVNCATPGMDLIGTR